MFHESLWVYFIGSISFLKALTVLMYQVNFSSQIRLVLLPGEIFLLFRRKHHKARARILSELKTLASMQHLIFMSAALSFRVDDRVWVLFPRMSVSWDEVWLMSDLSWAPRRDFCQHLQSGGHQRDSDMPLDTTRRRGGTSVTGSGHVHFWGLLLQFGPLGTSEWRQADASPTPPSQLDRGGQASSQIQHPNQAAGVWYSPLSLCLLIHWRTTAIRKGGGNNW